MPTPGRCSAGNLVAERLAAAGGHEHERVAAGDDVLDDLLLMRPELRIAEHLPQGVQRCLAGHGGGRRGRGSHTVTVAQRRDGGGRPPCSRGLASTGSRAGPDHQAPADCRSRAAMWSGSAALGAAVVSRARRRRLPWPGTRGRCRRPRCGGRIWRTRSRVSGAGAGPSGRRRRRSRRHGGSRHRSADGDDPADGRVADVAGERLNAMQQPELAEQRDGAIHRGLADAAGGQRVRGLGDGVRLLRLGEIPPDVATLAGVRYPLRRQDWPDVEFSVACERS